MNGMESSHSKNVQTSCLANTMSLYSVFALFRNVIFQTRHVIPFRTAV